MTLRTAFAATFLTVSLLASSTLAAGPGSGMPGPIDLDKIEAAQRAEEMKKMGKPSVIPKKEQESLDAVKENEEGKNAGGASSPSVPLINPIAAEAMGKGSSSSSSGGQVKKAPQPIKLPGHSASQESGQAGDKKPDAATKEPSPVDEAAQKKFEQCTKKCDKKYNSKNDQKLVELCAGGTNEQCSEKKHKKMIETQNNYAQCISQCNP